MKYKISLSRLHRRPRFMSRWMNVEEIRRRDVTGWACPWGIPFVVCVALFTPPFLTPEHLCEAERAGFTYNLAIAQDAVTSVTPLDDFQALRENMVKNQIEARGVKNKRVLEAMRKVERHRFVPLLLRHLAYKDMPLPIGESQTISQPYIVGLMTELLELKGNEKVLEIGTGSGYQAAILAELAKEVYTIEILPKLASRAEELLQELGYKNIKVKCADGYLGWPKAAPFDAIIVTCAPEEIPEPLIEQLTEAGRMVIPLGTEFQELKLLIKTKGELIQKDIVPVRFVPMMRK